MEWNRDDFGSDCVRDIAELADSDVTVNCVKVLFLPDGFTRCKLCLYSFADTLDNVRFCYTEKASFDWNTSSRE